MDLYSVANDNGNLKVKYIDKVQLFYRPVKNVPKEVETLISDTNNFLHFGTEIKISARMHQSRGKNTTKDFPVVIKSISKKTSIYSVSHKSDGKTKLNQQANTQKNHLIKNPSKNQILRMLEQENQRKTDQFYQDLALELLDMFILDFIEDHDTFIKIENWTMGLSSESQIPWKSILKIGE